MPTIWMLLIERVALSVVHQEHDRNLEDIWQWLRFSFSAKHLECVQPQKKFRVNVPVGQKQMKSMALKKSIASSETSTNLSLE